MVVGMVAATAALSAALPQFELSRVRARVAREHPELTPEKLDELEIEYRQFLLMCRNEPNVAHQPSKELDWYWHAHILHTKQYEQDCLRYFGHFLHHEPRDGASEHDCDHNCCAHIG